MGIRFQRKLRKMQGKAVFALVVTGIILVSALYFLYSGSSIIDGLKAALSPSDEEAPVSRDINSKNKSVSRDINANTDKPAANNDVRKGEDAEQEKKGDQPEAQEETPTDLSNAASKQQEQSDKQPAEDNPLLTPNEKMMDDLINDKDQERKEDQPKAQEETPTDLNNAALEQQEQSSKQPEENPLLTPNKKMRDDLINDKDFISYDEGFTQAGESVIFCREARPKDQNSEKATVLLLHGSQFSSTVWINIGTMKLLASLNYRVVAIDLPGKARSKESKIPDGPEQQLKFMVDLMQALQLERPIIVSPSKSGDYAVPFLINHPDHVRGFVALAPTATGRYTIQQYEQMTVPTLVIVGQRDETLIAHAAVDNLQHVPNRKMYVIENMAHACYVDHPPTFHKLLLNFLETLQ